MQDYQLVVRAVWGGATILAGQTIVAQNLSEALDYLREVYLSNGYTVQSVDFLGETLVNELEQSNSPKALRFAWHLVKDVN